MIALAWRNLWRQGRRSLVTLLVVALVVFLAILYYSLGGATSNSIYGDLTREVGHIQVHAAGYRDARNFGSGLLQESRELRQKLVQSEPDALIAGSLQVPVLIAGETRSRGIALSGQDWPPLLREDMVRDLTEGSFIEAGNLTDIVLGASLARALAVGVGDDVYVYAPGTEGFGAAAYRVRGLLELGDPNREIGTAYLSLAAAQELAAPGAVSALQVYFPDIHTLAEDNRVQDAAVNLRRVLGGELEVESWRELDPAMANFVNYLAPVMIVATSIFFLLAGLLVLNTVYLSTLERIREFGVLISLGARGRTVMGMITLESVLMCLLGAAIGLGLGLASVASLADGFIFPGQEETFEQLGMNPMLYPSVEPWQVLVAVGFALTTAILASLWPASIAARTEPAEAMRYVA